jgi:hypothetical protein
MPVDTSARRAAIVFNVPLVPRGYFGARKD